MEPLKTINSLQKSFDKDLLKKRIDKKNNHSTDKKKKKNFFQRKP